jgi:hypothetical protein
MLLMTEAFAFSPKRKFKQDAAEPVSSIWTIIEWHRTGASCCHRFMAPVDPTQITNTFIRTLSL